MCVLFPFSEWSCSSTRLVILPPEVTGRNPLWRFWIIYGGRNTFDHNFEMLCYICYRCRKAAFSAMRVLDNRPGQSCSKPSRVDNTGGLQLFVSKVWRPCLISGKSPYKKLLPILCLVWPASMWCCRSHGWASQHAGKEPRWCSGSACCLRRVDSRTSPPPPASRGVLQTLPCYVSYHVKYKYSNN